MKRKIFTFAALSLLCAFAVAGTDALPPAEETLTQAVEKQKNLTFSAINVYEKDTIKSESKVFQRKSEDGTVFARTESGVGSISITNADGSFAIFPELKKALKHNAAGNDLIATRSDLQTYEIKQGSFMGKDCYIVTVRSEDTPELQAEFEARMREAVGNALSADQLKQAYRQNFTAATDFYNGVDDLLPLLRFVAGS